MISTQKSDKEKSMTTTNKEYVEGSFNWKTSRHNIMYTFFYSNISEFAVELKGVLDEEKYQTSIWNIHKLVWKGNFFKYANVSILGHGCGVSQYPQFYERTKNIYQMLPSPYVGSCSCEKGHQFL